MIKAKKALGQNFLNEDTIINNIVSLLNAKENDLVVEIGPGMGALTKKLVNLPSKTICIELDKDMKPYLDKLSVDVIYDDVLKIDFESLLKDYNYNNLYIIGNLPYYITTPIIEHITKSKINFNKAIIMVQKEVGQRLTALPATSQYGYMTVYLDYYYNVKYEFDVNKKYFSPMPKVDSAIISLNKINKYPFVEENKYFDFVKDCFKYKRKNLKNNLKEYNLEKIESILNKHNLSLSSRAEQLNQEVFLEIYKNI